MATGLRVTGRVDAQRSVGPLLTGSTPENSAEATRSYFPRFVQKAIWRYCAQQGEDICNGNRIDDARRCQNTGCRIHGFCDRVAVETAM